MNRRFYNIVYYFRVGFSREVVKQLSQKYDFEIDKSQCLNILKKIKQGDFSGFNEIDNVNAHIQNLRNEIS